MFAEEEWNDDADAKALTKAVIRGTPVSKGASVTPNACSRKRSLLRTLQSLSAVPDWSQDTVRQHSDDSDGEGAPPPAKRKKKRSRKQRRTAASGEDGAGLESRQEDVKKQPGSKLSKGKNRKDSRIEVRTEKKAVEGSERMDLQPKAEQSKEVERQLSRQQWRNKMKNKRKCKNKYRQSTGQTQSGPKAGVSQQQGVGTEPGSAPPTHSRTGKIKRRSRGKGEVHEEEKPAAMGRTDEMVLSEGHSNGEVGRVKGHPATGDKRLSRETEEMESKRKREGWQQKMRAEKLRKILQNVRVESRGAAEQVETQDSRCEEEEEQEEEDRKQKAETRSAEGAALDRSAALKARMEQRLEAARFRYINEQLYTSSSGEARRMFLQDPHAFDVYHRGFTAQVQRWPTNPVDSIIAYIKNRPASQVVADFGCGDCKIARSVKNKVHSFDLAPVCDLVTVCDMAKVPLPKASVHIAVFCLSLMGTNLLDFLVEANRVLVMGGVLKIAEVASRFENVRSFVGALSSLGFKLASKDTENSHFYSFEFVKTGDVLEKTRKKGLELKPCVYKKR